MTKASPIRPHENNHDVSTQTTAERPAGLPNERIGREWDDKIEGLPGASRNLKREAQDTPAALETVEPGQTPSRKSTRGSTSHLKGATSKGTAVSAAHSSPSARAQRSQSKQR